MTKIHYLPVAGVLAAASLASTACGASSGSAPSGTPSASGTSSASGTPSASGAPSAARTSAPADPGAAASTAVSAGTGPTASATAGGQRGFAGALAAWNAAASTPAAMMDGDFQRAADDLRGASDASYGTAISELTFLASLPATNVPATQRAKARADVKALDKFFGTPGLLQ